MMAGRARKVKACIAVVLLFAVAFAGLGCAPQAAKDGAPGIDEGADAELATISWSPGADCSTCHDRESDSFEDSACLASQHSEVTCSSCHSDETILAEVHVDADASAAEKAKLKETEIDETLCEGCHGSWNDLAQATAGVTVLTDSAGTTVNPHEVKTVHNAASQHDSIAWSSCHEMHTGSVVGESAQQVCLDCHHSGEYTCNTCHE